MTTIPRSLVGAFACAALAACSSIELPTKKIEYKSAGKLPSLEVPPDLTRPTNDERFAVPDAGPRGGAATFSAYQRDREGREQTGPTGSVLPAVQDARVERAGSQRWLVVKGDPEKLWPIVKDFWAETGFTVNIELPEAGVMETDWAENRAKLPDGFLRNTLGRFLDSVYSTSERDKFRTRLERGSQPGSTEIYISHRGMEEVVASRSIISGPENTKWQPRPPDPELEAEMLRRLLVRFGVQEARAKDVVASVPTTPRASLKRGENRLTVDDAFDRAWRRVGLALDRVGFTVEDRDRSNGVYFVRYIDPDADNKNDKGWLSRLKFWKSDEPKKEQYRVVLKDGAAGTEVAVQTKDGAAETSPTASRILTLLYDQLK